ncbi:hypothetical protein BG006_001525 [Podila minutissima]|uniref:Cytochrome P450 n=1 Tax=Podila minutissima TaxID=64525 RepID=A0A9P5ST32_9FUNG|nr:hypothetical protein BG006_001525 [Podila minutissima]
MPPSLTIASILSLLQKALANRNVAKALGVYVLYILFKYRSTAMGAKPRKDIVGPRGLPLIGNVITILGIPRNQLAQHNAMMHRKYGKVWCYTVPKIGRIIRFNDPDILEHVLKTNFWAYEKGALLRDNVSDLLGQGIFAVDGHQWKWQRKLASHVFTVKGFRTYTSEVFVQEGQKVVDYLGKIADQGRVIDLQEVFYKFTLDSFGEVSFGQSFGCLDNPEEDVEFAAAFDRMNTAVFNRLFDASWRLREWYTGVDKQVSRDKKIVVDFALGIIRKRREEGYNKPQKDLLQLFMDSEGDDGKPLSEEMLKDLCLNFIIAGRDTTAQALSWMFYLLHRSSVNRGILPKLVSEISSSLGNSSPTYEVLKQMKYAEACLYESLRIYPSVPRNLKICVQDDVWPDGTKVYKGESVAWHPWAMGRNEAIWGPDAEVYNPERWMTGEKPSSSKFPAFHTGPRTCLGQQFATVEAVTIMSLLFRSFTFELMDPHTEPEYTAGLTLNMAKGLPVRVKRRV